MVGRVSCSKSFQITTDFIHVIQGIYDKTTAMTVGMIIRNSMLIRLKR